MILLDTCALYHWSMGTLPAAAHQAINERELRYLCAISGWEVACKHRDGKVTFTDGPARWIERAVAALHLQVISGTLEDGITAALLPLHHRDPCDRLIIATAKRLSCPVVTSDEVWPLYGVQTIWERNEVRSGGKKGRK